LCFYGLLRRVVWWFDTNVSEYVLPPSLAYGGSTVLENVGIQQPHDGLYPNKPHMSHQKMYNYN